MTRLDPDEVRRLLHDAVDDLRPSPEGYDLIRVGIERRRRMRLPAMALGGVALAGVTAIAVVAVAPHATSQVVEPASSFLSTTPPDTAVPTSDGTSSAVLGGGGSGGTGPQAPHRATPTPRATATRTRPSSPEGTPGPGVTAPSSRSPVPPPLSAPAKAGDVDGDGIADPVTAAGNSLVVDLSRSGSVSVPLPSLVAPLSATVTDLDGDGYGEIVVQTGSSAAGAQYSVLRLAASGALTVLGGGPLPLTAGSSPTAGTGFTCAGGTVVTVAGTSTDGHVFAVTSTTWKLVGNAFQRVGTPTSSTVDTTASTSPFTATCGAL